MANILRLLDKKDGNSKSDVTYVTYVTGLFLKEKKCYLECYPNVTHAESKVIPSLVDNSEIPVTAYTPNGNQLTVFAKSPAHAEFLRRMNPAPRIP